MIEQPDPAKLILPQGEKLGKIIKLPDSQNDTELRNGLKVEKSQIEGMGLFADRDFKQYEVIWFERLKGRGANPENGGPLRWANHSDDPNAALVLTQGGLFEVSLVAVKIIKQNEEITYNYGVFGHSGHRAECNCGDPNCKGFFNLRTEWGEKK